MKTDTYNLSIHDSETDQKSVSIELPREIAEKISVELVGTSLKLTQLTFNTSPNLTLNDIKKGFDQLDQNYKHPKSLEK